MTAKSAKLEDFLCCRDTNQQDKICFLAAQNLHFLHSPVLQHSMHYCHIAGMLAETPVDTHYSSLTVVTESGSNLAESMVTVQPWQPVFLNALLSICYLKVTCMS